MGVHLMQINSSSLTCQCKHCLDELGVPVYVTVPLSPVPTTGHPMYCPRCRRRPAKPAYRPQDYADCLILRYDGLTRKGAIHAIATYNELSARGKLPSTVRDAYDLPAILWGFKPMLSSQPITPLTVHCTSCAGSYTLIRSAGPSLQQSTPLYCVWCGSSHTTLSQDDTEETAWLSLANHYSLSVQQVQFFYNKWSQLPAHTYPTFSAYLQSDLVAPIFKAAQQSLQASANV